MASLRFFKGSFAPGLSLSGTLGVAPPGAGVFVNKKFLGGHMPPYLAMLVGMPYDLALFGQNSSHKARHVYTRNDVEALSKPL